MTDLIFPLRVRLAGVTRHGDPMPSLDEDVARFQRLESPFVDWRDELEAAAAEPNVERDAHGISDHMRVALSRFQKEGGHSNRLSPEKIRYLIEHGVVAFLELQVRQDMHLTLGSVSALSHAPWSTIAQSKAGPHPLWPQYDWRTTMPGTAPDDQVQEDANKHVLIARSSVLPKIDQRYFTEELAGRKLPKELVGRDLRRLGMAARGKYEVLAMAKEFGQTHLTFNIGTLGIPGEKSLNRSNQPSEAHNAWMFEKGWRQHSETIVPETSIHKKVTMYWRRYCGLIEAGFDEFTLPGGLLEGKGYPIDELETSARDTVQIMQDLIASGRHEPWLSALA